MLQDLHQSEVWVEHHQLQLQAMQEEVATEDQQIIVEPLEHLTRLLHVLTQVQVDTVEELKFLGTNYFQNSQQKCCEFLYY